MKDYQIFKDGVQITDEPFFVLRGRDEFSTAAIDCYVSIMRNEGYDETNPDFVKEVEDIADSFDDWQNANPDKVKYPD